jgi:putative oxidoreductase
MFDARTAAASDLAFRSLFSLIFIVAGVGHFVQKDVMLARLEQAPLGHLAALAGPPEITMALSGAALIVCGVALLVGYRVEIAAAVLLLALIPITVTVHLGDPSHVGPLFKNLALMGGLIHFVVRGGGAFSIDERRAAPAADEANPPSSGYAR